MSTSPVMSAAEFEIFFAGYLATALWSSTDEGGESLDALYSPDDLSEKTREKQRAECLDFVTANAADLTGIKPTEAGHLFWLNRNGHGAGFWDRGLGERGDRLSDAAKVYGAVDLYLGDDGVIHAG